MFLHPSVIYLSTDLNDFIVGTVETSCFSVEPDWKDDAVVLTAHIVDGRHGSETHGLVIMRIYIYIHMALLNVIKVLDLDLDLDLDL